MRIITIGVNTARVYKTNMCACIGYFDGVHKGHQALISKTIEMAHEKNCESALITFDPDPWTTIKGDQDVRHITTMKERINRSIALGIQNIVILDFTVEMSRLSPEDFINLIRSHLSLKGLVCGFDFHYGYMGKGSAEMLSSCTDMEVAVVAPVEDDRGKISSTRISDAIMAGDMTAAKEMMGFYYQIEGTVIRGRQQGRDIGYPTANIRYSKEYLLPKTGVYAGYIKHKGKYYQAMINLGHNPTFNYYDNLSLEAHILDFRQEIYDQTITVIFVKYIRPEKKFKNKNNLIMQLDQDVYTIREILKKNEY